MGDKKVRILYVDDDPDDFLLIQSMLKQYKATEFELVRAADYQEAIPLISESFDAYLVDYRLGQESGLDVLEAIKKNWHHAPVIILTGMENGRVDDEAMQIGASDYLVKGGFDAQTLGRTIRYAMRDSELHQTLEIAGKRFKNIFERSADPIVLIDYNSFILDANPSFVSNFDYNPANPISKPRRFKDLIVDEEDKQRFCNILKTKLEVADFQTRIQISEDLEIEALISIVQHESDFDFYQLMIKDLTSLKMREEENFNLKKFSSTGRIARLLAHEVKNPLTTILLSADQLGFELPESLMEESGDLLDIIKRNCNRINQLVTQLLDSTRFTELQIEDHSLNLLLDEALDQVQDRIILKKIKVSKDYDNEICDVQVDGEKIKIALVNLIVNAVEAMDSNSGHLKLITKTKEEKCLVEISDNGGGIPPENMERLFEPFFTSKPSGSGLGLTNTQNIILSHRGTLRVKSEPNVGTSFFITFNVGTGNE